MSNADMPVHGELKQVGNVALKNGGLTKREYFAAMAMQGMLSQHEAGHWEDFARGAVYAADALLAELDK